jgi:hypothetical protein
MLIPGRIAPLIAAESDARKVHDILSDEIEQALIEISTPSA